MTKFLYNDANGRPVYGLPFDGFGKPVEDMYNGSKFTSVRRDVDVEYMAYIDIYIDDPKLGRAPLGVSNKTIPNGSVFHVVSDTIGRSLMQRLIAIDGSLYTLAAYQWERDHWAELVNYSS